jgi:D-aminoacyl-tRNA deacylase
MRAVIQRVGEASVTVEGKETRSIGRGMAVLLGIGREDGPEDVSWLVRKIASMRIFEDEEGKTNKSLHDIEGEALVVSQFTLYASTKKGNRPSFDPAAPPEMAVPLYESFVREFEAALGKPVPTGEFGASMSVSLTNEGPLTILMDSKIRE